MSSSVSRSGGGGGGGNSNRGTNSKFVESVLCRDASASLQSESHVSAGAARASLRLACQAQRTFGVAGREIYPAPRSPLVSRRTIAAMTRIERTAPMAKAAPRSRSIRSTSTVRIPASGIAVETRLISLTATEPRRDAPTTRGPSMMYRSPVLIDRRTRRSGREASPSTREPFCGVHRTQSRVNTMYVSGIASSTAPVPTAMRAVVREGPRVSALRIASDVELGFVVTAGVRA